MSKDRRALYICDGVDPAAPIDRAALLPEGGLDLRSELAQYERDLLSEALHRTGSKKETARLLRLDTANLYNRLKRHGLDSRDAYYWRMSPEEAREMRMLAVVGYTLKEIAEQTGYSRTTVWQALKADPDDVRRAARQMGLCAEDTDREEPGGAEEV